MLVSGYISRYFVSSCEPTSADALSSAMRHDMQEKAKTQQKVILMYMHIARIYMKGL